MVTKKIAKITGILYRIKDCFPIPARLRFYCAIIYPYLTYNVIVWGSAYKVYSNENKRKHKKTIRVLVDALYLVHTTGLIF